MTTMICFENLPTILHLHLQFLWMCNTNGSKNWGFSDRTEVQSLTASLTAKCVKYFDLASVCLKSFFFGGGGTRFLEQHFRDQFPGQVRLLSMLKVSKSVLFACTVLKWNHSRCIGTSCVELLRFLLLYNENTQVVSVIVGLWLDRHTNHPSNNRSSKYCAQ